MPIVNVDPTGEEIYVPDHQTILDGLYAAGHAYRIGCRRGGCGVCKVDLLAGRVSYNRPVAAEVLTAEERGDGVCLTCRAVPESDVTLRFRSGSLRLVQPLLLAINEAARLRAAARGTQPLKPEE